MMIVGVYIMLYGQLRAIVPFEYIGLIMATIGYFVQCHYEDGYKYRLERIEKKLDKFDIVMKLFKCFPGSTINSLGEFIAEKSANEYFNLEKCKDELEVKCEVLEWLSRGACKSTPFQSEWRNKKYHNFMRSGINEFLGTNFSEDDMYEIYTYIGNQVNRKLTLEFIINDYDLSLLRRKKE